MLHPLTSKTVARWTKIKAVDDGVEKATMNADRKIGTKIESNRFFCDRCPKWFPLKSRLRRHMYYHNLRLSCDYCPKRFYVKRILKRHIDNRHNLKIYYYCDHCPKRSGVKSRLERHIKESHRKFICEVCGSHFNKYRLWLAHFNKHEELLTCPFCDKKVKARSLKSHKSYYHIYERDKKREACPICGKMTVVHYLKAHIRSHDRFKCEKCQTSFKTPFELKA